MPKRERERPSEGKSALLVVDVQEAAVALGPYLQDVVLENIARLIAVCRTAGVEVIYVQHEEPGGDLERGSRGWQIHGKITPQPGEKIVRKRFNSAFRETELRSYLEARDITNLILVGMQTEYCIDTTCRVAFEHGFSVVVPEQTNTTFDNGELTARQIYDLYNQRIFDGRFAALRSMTDTMEAIGRRGRPLH